MMGAVRCDGVGVRFQVWAPNAVSVAVAGDFNDWSSSAHPLTPHGGGYWSVVVAEAITQQQYRYVIVTPTGEVLWRNDPYARSICHGARGVTSLIPSDDERYGTPEYSMPPWNQLVIYEIHIRTFLYDPRGYLGTGSFVSAASKLDYLKDLGINAIELMPIGEFLGDVSAGYNPAYIFAIEDEYGGPDGLRSFVNEAHRRGIAVIVDIVFNHLGTSAGDMWQFDGWSQNGKGGIYFYNDWRSHTDWGETRFDYGRPEVRQYLADNVHCLLQEWFIDGLRWDATGSIRNVYGRDNDRDNDIADGWSLMQWINSLIDQDQPWKISIAEDMKDNSWITRQVEGGGAGFDAQWSAGFVEAVRAALIPADDAARSMRALASMIAQSYNDNAFARVIFTESHDADSNGAQRMPEMIWPGNPSSWASIKRSTLGAALVLTAPGIPLLFMGQEFLAAGWFNDDKQLDWSRAAQFQGIHTLCRDLIHLRRNWFDHTRGLGGQGTRMFHVNDADKVIAYHRWDRGGPRDDVIVLLNFANRGYASYTIGLPRAGGWRLRFNSDWVGYHPSLGNWPSFDMQADQAGRDGMPSSGSVALGPYSALILSQD